MYEGTPWPYLSKASKLRSKQFQLCSVPKENNCIGIHMQLISTYVKTETSILPESFRGSLDYKYSSSLFPRHPLGCWHPRNCVQMLAVCCISWAAPSLCLAPMASSTSRNTEMDWGRVWQALDWFIQSRATAQIKRFIQHHEQTT